MGPIHRKLLLTFLLLPLAAQALAKPELILSTGDLFTSHFSYEGRSLDNLGELKQVISISGDKQAIGSVEAAQRDKIAAYISLGLGLGLVTTGLMISLDDGNRDTELPSALAGTGFGLGGLFLLLDRLSGLDAEGAVKHYDQWAQGGAQVGLGLSPKDGSLFASVRF
ncbi:MAG TPA: hypothetical protein VHE12_11180 [bacterium]|nr:hypothetical protein [bacterium]